MGGKDYRIHRERDIIFFSKYIFLKLQINGFYLFPLRENKTPEIYEQCCLFIIQKLFSYHMVGNLQRYKVRGNCLLNSMVL